MWNIIFRGFEEKEVIWISYIWDCTVLTCQWTTVACEPKPGHLVYLKMWTVRVNALTCSWIVNTWLPYKYGSNLWARHSLYVSSYTSTCEGVKTKFIVLCCEATLLLRYLWLCYVALGNIKITNPAKCYTLDRLDFVSVLMNVPELDVPHPETQLLFPCHAG